MRSLRSFILQVNPPLLQQFFWFVLVDHQPLSVCWGASRERLIQSIQQAFNAFPSDITNHVQHEMHRVERLTHVYAQQCLSRLIGSCDDYHQLRSSYERSCYAYLHAQSHFQAVETLCHQHHDHDDPWWGQYVLCGTAKALSVNDETCQLFRSYLAERLATAIDNILIYPTESTRGGNTEIYIDIYHRVNTQTQLCFVVDTIDATEQDNICHYTLAYCCHSRLIEVQAPEVSKQHLIAQCFAHVFLGINLVALRPMNLDPFRHKAQLQWDDNDGITHLNVGRIRIENINTTHSTTHFFSVGANDPDSIQHYFDCSYRGFNPVRSDQFRLTEVSMHIHLKARGYTGGPGAIALSLALPNQSNLRNRRFGDQILGEKILVRWGVLEALTA